MIASILYELCWLIYTVLSQTVVLWVQAYRAVAAACGVQ